MLVKLIVLPTLAYSAKTQLKNCEGSPNDPKYGGYWGCSSSHHSSCVLTKLPDFDCTNNVKCNTRTGLWKGRAQCRYNGKKKQLPERPNGDYKCNIRKKRCKFYCDDGTFAGKVDWNRKTGEYEHYEKNWYFCCPEPICLNGDAYSYPQTSSTVCPEKMPSCKSCKPGYTLEEGVCNENVCSCLNGNGAVGMDCSVSGTEFCSGCDNGYFLEAGKCVEIPCDHYGMNCKNQAECENTVDFQSYICKCQPGYTGEHCEIPILCYFEPCENSGICTDSADFSSYSCDCGTEFTGTNCETQIPCASNPCKNSGICTDSADFSSFSCDCGTDFTGTLCQIQIPCASDPCQNSGDCISEISGTSTDYNCYCSDEFTGKNCEIQIPCRSYPCQNSGVCSNSADFTDYSCSCSSEFTGKNCESVKEFLAVSKFLADVGKDDSDKKLSISLTWNVECDLDLYVFEPSGDLLYSGNHITTYGEFNVDAFGPGQANVYENGDRKYLVNKGEVHESIDYDYYNYDYDYYNGPSSSSFVKYTNNVTAIENISWRTLLPGTYRIAATNYQDCSTNYKIYIQLDGVTEVIEEFQPDDGKLYEIASLAYDGNDYTLNTYKTAIVDNDQIRSKPQKKRRDKQFF